MRKTAVALVVLLAACSKSSSGPSTAAPSGAPAVPAAAAPAPAADAKALLSDEKKVIAYLAYQKEMMPHTKTAVDMAMGGFNRGARDAKSMEKEMKKDDRMDTFNAAHQAALKNAGLTAAEWQTMVSAVSEYATHLYLGKKAEKENAEQAQKDPKGGGIAAKINEAYITGMKDGATKFAEKYGQAALDNVNKHADEFVEIQEATMKSVLGK